MPSCHRLFLHSSLSNISLLSKFCNEALKVIFISVIICTIVFSLSSLLTTIASAHTFILPYGFIVVVTKQATRFGEEGNVAVFMLYPLAREVSQCMASRGNISH